MLLGNRGCGGPFATGSLRLIAFARLAPLRSQADVQIRVNLMGKRLFDVSFHTAFVQDDGLSLGAWAAA